MDKHNLMGLMELERVLLDLDILAVLTEEQRGKMNMYHNRGNSRKKGHNGMGSMRH